MFVTIEGLDGCGCTTVTKAIQPAYPNILATEEPTERTYGTLMRENLSDETTGAVTDVYLFMADRVDHINNVVRPADENGYVVVSDRYADSTRAYQPVALQDAGVFESQFEAKAWLETVMAPWYYEPDLTIYLDISVETAIERSDGDEKYERREFLEAVKDNYDALCESDEYGERIVRVDAEQSEEAVVDSVLGKIDVAAPDRL